MMILGIWVWMNSIEKHSGQCLVRYASVALTIALLLMASAGFGLAGVTFERPSPLNWKQWQPETDRSDVRLDQQVSVWQARITLGDLLAGLSYTTSVELLSIGDLSSVGLTSYVKSGLLEEIMCGLADLVDGYWAIRTDQEPPIYCLTTFRPSIDLDDEYLMWFARDTESIRNAPFLNTRQERMSNYQAALKLGAQQLLDSYAQEDPWLCAQVLDPVLRPMIEHVTSLGSQEQRELLEYGHIELPLRSSPPSLVRHLAQWSKGEFGGMPSYMSPAIDPDRFLRFHNPQEAWSHAWIEYIWLGESLQVQLNVPDYGRWYTAIITQASASPYFARQHLISQGYRRDSPEYQKEIEEETERWQQANGIGPSEPPFMTSRREPLHSHVLQGDPRLSSPLDLSVFSGSVPIGMGSLLEQIAAQYEVNAMMLYLPPERYSLVPREGTATEVLIRTEEDLRGTLEWHLKGRYLLGINRDPSFWIATVPPETTVAHMRQLLAEGKPVSIDDLASLFGNLNVLQVENLKGTFPQLREAAIRLGRLRLYGTLSKEQRDALWKGERLSVDGFTRRQQGILLSIAREDRPWLNVEDLAGSTLRMEHVRLSTLEDGVSLIAEYTLPGEGTDRDEVFRAPCEVSF